MSCAEDNDFEFQHALALSIVSDSTQQGKENGPLFDCADDDDEYKEHFLYPPLSRARQMLLLNNFDQNVQGKWTEEETSDEELLFLQGNEDSRQHKRRKFGYGSSISSNVDDDNDDKNDKK